MNPPADPSPQEPLQYPPHIQDALESIESLKLNGKHEESIREAQKLLCEDPDCVGALEELADNYVSLDRFQNAEKAARRALLLDKESYTAYYILGFLASHDQKWDASAEFLKKANNLCPNNPEILRCLGWSSFNAGKRAQGIVTLERALNLDSNNSLTLCDLGICYMQTKNFAKSTELLKKAMEIDPGNKRIQECYHAAKLFSGRYENMSPEVKSTKRMPQRKMFS